MARDHKKPCGKINYHEVIYTRLVALHLLLPHSLTYSLTYSLTHSFTHSFMSQIQPLSLLGCMVRRSVCVPCFQHFLLSCECGASRHSTSHHHQCVFQFPSPDSAAAFQVLEEASGGRGGDGCSAGFGGLLNMHMPGNDEDQSSDDHVYRMQREARVRAWLTQKQHVSRARAAVQRLHPDLSLDR
jgi:hypothetical protein